MVASLSSWETEEPAGARVVDHLLGLLIVLALARCHGRRGQEQLPAHTDTQSPSVRKLYVALAAAVRGLKKTLDSTSRRGRVRRGCAAGGP